MENNIIPQEFLNEEGEPMGACLMCGEKFREDSVYTVTKVYKNYPRLDSCQLLFEHAVCLDCVEKTKGSLSEASKQALEEYQQANVTVTPEALERWSECCLFSGIRLADEEEYAYYGIFGGGQIMEGTFPFAVGQTAMEEMYALLSASTKEFLDNFIDKHFSGPPEWKELMKDSPVVLF
ncbi:MAG: hypothetical protein MI784_10805 [Cytophagales bacterium]|nr:hypothetical protein [Cytophagales bacterium]